MSTVKLKEEKQKKLKTLTKIIEVLAKIGKVFCYIGLVFAIIGAIAMPVLINNMDIKDNELIFNNESVLKLEENENGITIKSGKQVVAKTDDPKEMKDIKEFFENEKTESTIMVAIEICIILIIVIIILIIRFLKHFIKFFHNINTEDTPFTLDNVEHIRKMAHIMIA